MGTERADTFLLVVSELATNALRHGGGRYTLQLFAGPDTLTAAVSDLSSAAPANAHLISTAAAVASGGT